LIITYENVQTLAFLLSDAYFVYGMIVGVVEGGR